MARPWLALSIALVACKGPNSPRSFEAAPYVNVNETDVFVDAEGATFDEVKTWFKDHGPMRGNAHLASVSEFSWRYSYGYEWNSSNCYATGATVEIELTRRLPRWNRTDAPAAELAKFKQFYDARVKVEERRLALVVALATKFVQKVDTMHIERSCDDLKPLIDREFNVFGERAEEQLATFDEGAVSP